MNDTNSPLWPDPFKTKPDNSLTSLMFQPTPNIINLPDPPVVQNPVARNSSSQRMAANRTGNVSLNEVDRKLNMSALDSIVCFPTKVNAKSNFSLNSQSAHSKQSNLTNDILGDLLR